MLKWNELLTNWALIVINRVMQRVFLLAENDIESQALDVQFYIALNYVNLVPCQVVHQLNYWTCYEV